MSTELLVAIVGVGGTLAGGALTGVITLLQASQQVRHDRRRWLLDQRLKAYVTLNDALVRFTEFTGSASVDPAQLSRGIPALTEILTALAPIFVVAPREVRVRGSALAELAKAAISALLDAATAEGDSRRRIEVDALMLRFADELTGMLKAQQADVQQA